MRYTEGDPPTAGYYLRHRPDEAQYFDGSAWQDQYGVLLHQTVEHPRWIPDEAGWFPSVHSGRYQYFNGSEWVNSLKSIAEIEELARPGISPLTNLPRPELILAHNRLVLQRLQVREKEAAGRANLIRARAAAEAVRETQAARARSLALLANARRAEESRSRRRMWLVVLAVLAVLVVIFLGRAGGIGASAKCRDGTFSYSQSHRGTCSWHGGVAQWLGGASDSSGDQDDNPDPLTQGDP